MKAVPPRVMAIMEEVAAKHKVTVKRIVGPDRARKIAFARFEAASRIRQLTFADGRPPSYPEIGRYLGGRDHSTVLAACRRWAEIEAAA